MQPTHIGRALADALRCDLAVDPSSEWDDWFLEPVKDPRDWTRHLARQLGLGNYRQTQELHDTLMMFIDPLDELLRAWPPAAAPADFVPVAERATAGIDAVELLAIIMRGPNRWRNKSIPSCKVGALEAHLRPLVIDGLATGLSEMVGRWEQVDVRSLRSRREEAIKAEERLRNSKQNGEAESRPVRKRPTPQELADLQRGRASAYIPPGRT